MTGYSDERYRQGAIGMGVSVALNLGLAALKIVTGYFGASQAVLADGFDSLFDAAIAMAVLFGLNLARRPADREHPYGHTRAETVAAAAVAILIFWAGLEVLQTALRTLLSGRLTVPNVETLWVAAGSLVVKELLFRYQLWLGRRLNSQAVVANAWNYRTDAFAALAALIAVAGARLGYPILDPVVGLLIAALILRTGVKLTLPVADELMDRAVEPETQRRLEQVVRSVRGVDRLDDLRTRIVGSGYLVDVKVGVRSDRTVEEGHAVAARVKEAILEDSERAIDAMVHVNPVPLEELEHSRSARERSGE